MRTARSSSHPGGGLHQHPPPGADTPPWDQTPPRADTSPPGADTAWEQTSPGSRHPPGADTPPVNRITDVCKNITLPQLRCGR